MTLYLSKVVNQFIQLIEIEASRRKLRGVLATEFK
jgi:hypothetical protein